jgi:DNA-binding Lrp family transcriptional regulator
VSTAVDIDLVAAIQDGLPLCARPFDAIARRLGTDEAAVIRRIRELREAGVIKRFGVVVRHRALGFRENAMVVWDVPDETVDEIGARMARQEGVTLCYRRPRRPPRWPYNLFCMIHGRDRPTALGRVDAIERALGLVGIRRAVLFGRREFKQRGARYVTAPRRGGEGRESAP